ncbi:hypothetical protein BDW72DRAFT_74679 [Aspergillus terricola var. indicus]
MKATAEGRHGIALCRWRPKQLGCQQDNQQQAFNQMYSTPKNQTVVDIRPYDSKHIDTPMQLPRSLVSESNTQDGVAFPQPGRQSENTPPDRSLEVPLMACSMGDEI